MLHSTLPEKGHRRAHGVQAPRNSYRRARAIGLEVCLSRLQNKKEEVYKDLGLVFRVYIFALIPFDSKIGHFKRFIGTLEFDSDFLPGTVRTSSMLCV